MKFQFKSEYFSFFYSFIGWRFYLLLLYSLISVGLDGIGLAVLIPLFQNISNFESLTNSNIIFIQIGSLFSALSIETTFLSVVVFLVLIFGLKGIFKFYESYYKQIINMRFILDLRKKMLNRMIDADTEYLLSQKKGRLVNIFTQEVNRVNTSFQQYLNFIQMMLLIIAYFSLALYVSFQFSLMVVGFAVVFNLPISILYRKTKRYSIQNTNITHNLQDKLMGYVQNLEHIRDNSEEEIWRKSIFSIADASERVTLRIGWIRSFLTAAREPLSVAALLISLIITKTFLHFSLDSIILSIVFLFRAISYISSATNIFNQFISAHGSLNSVLEIYNELEEHKVVGHNEVGNGSNVNL